MAKDIETMVKIRGENPGKITDFVAERLTDGFTVVNTNKVSDMMSNFTGGPFYRPWGFKATLKTEPLPNDETLMKLSAQPKMAAMGWVCWLLMIVFLIGGVEMRSFFPVLAAIIFMVAMMWEKKNVKRRLEGLLGELKVRFS